VNRKCFVIYTPESFLKLASVNEIDDVQIIKVPDEI